MPQPLRDGNNPPSGSASMCRSCPPGAIAARPTLPHLDLMGARIVVATAQDDEFGMLVFLAAPLLHKGQQRLLPGQAEQSGDSVDIVSRLEQGVPLQNGAGGHEAGREDESVVATPDTERGPSTRTEHLHPYSVGSAMVGWPVCPFLETAGASLWNWPGSAHEAFRK